MAEIMARIGREMEWNRPLCWFFQWKNVPDEPNLVTADVSGVGGK